MSPDYEVIVSYVFSVLDHCLIAAILFDHCLHVKHFACYCGIGGHRRRKQDHKTPRDYEKPIKETKGVQFTLTQITLTHRSR
ncbi:hypothetical protein M514_08094 [Trichuris suis]|uniref:Uncharacterized protein n=1 Tax=Trichuris suis TaxID=68888 RepID=A0A085NUX1_9BILA|nr:hypothetical protein M514_08094 [Trichuris suis]